MKIYLFVVFLIFGLTSCNLQETGGSSTYVKPSVDKNGRARKGYVRKSVSTSKGAVKNQNRSRYYYHTRKKQRSK
jgi:hypothetical protein